MARKKKDAQRPARAASPQGKRLTPEQKSEILEAGRTGATLQALADQFSVSIPTVRRIVGPRRAPAGATNGRGRPAGSVSGSGIQVAVDGDELVIRLPRKHLLRNLVGDLLD